MGSIVSGFYTLLGCGPTAEDKKRVKYLTRISSFSLLEASLPVFIAAAIANAAEAIIVGIGEETIALLIVQYMLYATIVYVVGKSITGVLYRDEENNSDHAFFVAIRKYKLSKLIRHVAAENSGFAWKEFFVTLALRLAFDEHGWGAAFAAWLAAVAFFVSAIFLSNWVQRAVLGVGLSTNDKLLSFDADAAALPLAFVLTVLLALGMRGLGAGFVSESSYLYAWNDQFEENAPGGPYTFDVCFAYALVVSLVVGSILALSNTAEEREEAQAEADHSAGSFQIEANAAGTAELTAPRRDGGWFRDSSPVDACRELWENFLGYFCGVAYFILVIDNIKLGPLIPQLDALVSSFLGVLFVALVVTWKGPNCLASMKLRQEKIEAKMAAAALKKRGASETASEVPADEEHGGEPFLSRFISCVVIDMIPALFHSGGVAVRPVRGDERLLPARGPPAEGPHDREHASGGRLGVGDSGTAGLRHAGRQRARQRRGGDAGAVRAGGGCGAALAGRASVHPRLGRRRHRGGGRRGLSCAQRLDGDERRGGEGDEGKRGAGVESDRRRGDAVAHVLGCVV